MSRKTDAASPPPTRQQPERWINLTGKDGKTKARLNPDTGVLVIKLRGECHEWSLREMLFSATGER